MNRFTDKLTPLTDRIFCLRSGSAADTQAIAQVVTYQLDFLSFVSFLLVIQYNYCYQWNLERK